MDILCCLKIEVDDEERKSVLKVAFKEYVAPFVLNSSMRPLILTIFLIWLFGSAMILPGISLGLEQDVAMPSDSYILDYFKVSLV